MVGAEEVFTTGNILLGLIVSFVVAVLLTAHSTISKPARKYKTDSSVVRAVYHATMFLTGVVVFMIPACFITFMVMWVITWD